MAITKKIENFSLFVKNRKKCLFVIIFYKFNKNGKHKSEIRKKALSGEKIVKEIIKIIL